MTGELITLHLECRVGEAVATLHKEIPVGDPFLVGLGLHGFGMEIISHGIPAFLRERSIEVDTE